MRLRLIIVPILTLALTGACTGAELTVAGIFGDDGVLQREVAVPVWGTTGAGEKVTVEFAGQIRSTTADGKGQWRVELAPMKARSEATDLKVRSSEKEQVVRNLLVGEVWYASGQSNMKMTVGSCAKKIEEIKVMMDSPIARMIRTARINSPDSPKMLGDLPSRVVWQKDTPKNRAQQSAVAYFFAKQLSEKLDVPIGVIEGSWGGKPIEGFIPREQFLKRESLKPILDLSNAGEVEKLKALEGGVIIRNTAGRPGRIYHSRVAPVAPFAIKGFIWYQGESNAGRGEDPRNYRIKTEALVDGWRGAWGRNELPFYFVQLPSYKDGATGWVRLREEQRRSLAIPNTGMAVTIDLLDRDIHPANKLNVGRRLARWALVKTYGQKGAFSGPLFRSAKIEGSQVRVSFDHVEEGLILAEKKGIAEPKMMKNGELRHFEVADANGKWHPAKATIAGREVLVFSVAVKNPIAVRYACEGEVENANLYNRAGLPASPFCSDLTLLPWEK